MNEQDLRYGFAKLEADHAATFAGIPCPGEHAELEYTQDLPEWSSCRFCGAAP
jgi:hypothetical protein